MQEKRSWFPLGSWLSGPGPGPFSFAPPDCSRFALMRGTREARPRKLAARFVPAATTECVKSLAHWELRGVEGPGRVGASGRPRRELLADLAPRDDPPTTARVTLHPRLDVASRASGPARRADREA